MADIMNRVEEWNGHSGEEIQKFIKTELNSCIGYFKSYDVDNTNNILVGFVDESTCGEWEQEFEVSTQPSKEALADARVLSHTNVAKSIPEDFYSAQLVNLYSSNKYISIDKSVVIPVKYLYTFNKYNVGTSSFDVTEESDEGTLTIQAKQSTVASWNDRTVKEMNMQINSSTEVKIDLTSFIDIDGKWDLRMRVTNGDKNIQSSWVTYTVIKTFIDIKLKTDWRVYQEGKISLRFDYEGDFVDKYINIEITGAGETSPGTKKELTNYPLIGGRGSYSPTMVSESTDTYHTFKHGIHNIKYWITIDKDPNYATPPKYAQIMVVEDKTDTTPYVIFNGLKGETESAPLINWIQNDITEFAVYAPDGKGGVISDFKTIFDFKNNAGDTVLQIQEEMNYGVSKVLSANLTLESNVLALYMYCYSENGNNMLGKKDSIRLYISNLGDYAPSTNGIKFVLNPRIRSNNESEVERVKIYNTALETTEEVDGVVWENVSFNNYDGWIQDSNGIKCLRILDGCQLTIPYQVFAKEDNTDTSYTAEITMAIRNVVNPNIPIFSIKNENDGEINGFEMCGSRGYFLLNKSRDEKDIMDNSDIMYTENTKMHITVCVNNLEKRSGDIVKATVPTSPDEYKSVTLSQNYNFIRIYIDGVLSRIIDFPENGIDPSIKRDIVIGNVSGESGADIDIYEIRVFKGDNSKPDYEILKDYCSSLTTTEEKNGVIARNKVLGGEESNAFRAGDISLASVKALGYNTLVWKPGAGSNQGFVRPNGREFGQTDKKKGNDYRIGDLEVTLYKTNADGTRERDDHRSGTLHNMTTEGQGTTAMMYFKWNQRYRFDGVEIEGGEPLVSKFVALDETVIEEGYDLNSNDPIIGRLDGKINWASSMHSHKMGSTSLYHDCWKKVVGGNALTKLTSVEAFNDLDLEKMGSSYTTSEDAYEGANKFTGRDSGGYGSCRVCVRQEPFMYFVQPTEGSEPVFYGMLTWGASKGDKPTFGYNKKFNPYFTMIEGSDNFRDLIECKVPWDDVHMEQTAWKDGEVDGPMVYHTTGGDIDQFEFSMGNSAQTAVGSHWDKNPCLRMFKDMINFIYLHSPNIEKFDGSYEDLKNRTDLPKSKMYWVTKSSEGAPSMGNTLTSSAYDLYRYNIGDDPNGWVPAGLYNSETNTYAQLNLIKQTLINEAVVQLSTANDLFIKQRMERFLNGYSNCPSHEYSYNEEYPNGINDFMHLNDLRFTVQFLKLIAGTDNWSKNTYIYNTGIYYKQNEDGTYRGGSQKYDGLDKFGFFQDDLDTIFEIDNYGAKTKPYYVEEHDYTINKDGEIDYYWNSEDNALYKSAEMSDPEAMRTVMNSILGAMSDLGGDPIKCFDKYYQQKAQKYFPEIVYNKAAELTYIDGYYRGSSDERHSYYLSQCLGGQSLAEKDWQTKRINYMSSYASYGDFAGGTSGAGLGFTPMGNISLNLTPHIWIYPIASEGSNTIRYSGSFEEAFNVPGRVPEGKSFGFSFNSTAGSENAVSLKGNRFYRDYGNLARVKPVNGVFSINGEYITKFEIVGTKENGGIVFNPTKIEIPAGSKIDNLRSINISGPVYNNVKIFDIESVDLSPLWRLENLDLTATNIKKINLPQNSNLESIKLPNTIQTLKLDGLNKLTTFELKGYSNLTSIVIKDMTQIFIDSYSYQIFNSCYDANTKLNELSIHDINWEGLTNDQLNYLLNIENLTLTGVINIENSAEVDFNMKMLLIDKFGDIDLEDNDLHIKYTIIPIEAEDLKVTGETYVYNTNNSYQYALNKSGNNISSVEWSINSEYASIDPKTGVLTLNSLPDSKLDAIVSCKLYIWYNGDIIEITVQDKTIHLYQKDVEVGDYIYSDGYVVSQSESSLVDTTTRTLIGICYYVDGDDRRMVSITNFSDKSMWGLGKEIGNASNNLTKGSFDGTEWKNENIKSINLGITQSPVYGDWPDDYSGFINRMNDELKSISYTSNTPNSSAYVPRDSYTSRTDGSLYPQTYFEVGDTLPKGQIQTISIIEHRNELSLVKAGISKPGLDRAVGKYNIENEFNDLTEKLSSATEVNQMALYPAASYCYAYEPESDNGNLLDKFKKGNWYLPTIEELDYVGQLLSKGISKDSLNIVMGDSNTDNEYWSSDIYDQNDTHVFRFKSNGTKYIFHRPNESMRFIKPVCRF